MPSASARKRPNQAKLSDKSDPPTPPSSPAAKKRRQAQPPTKKSEAKDSGGLEHHNHDREWSHLLVMELPKGFRLCEAVCNYGHFLLAPNCWIPSESFAHEDTHGGGALERPLRYGAEENDVVRIRIEQPPLKGGSAPLLHVHLEHEVNTTGQQSIQKQLQRMLRLDFDLGDWHALHEDARKRGFGRLYRGPTLFEDMCKTVLNCNIHWTGTVRMSNSLCKKIGTQGAFPAPQQLARYTGDQLRDLCGLGYRGERISRLARAFVAGEVCESWFDDPSRTRDEVYEKTKRLYGFGHYAAASICQMTGHYSVCAYDSETVRHFVERHGQKPGTDLTIVAKRADATYAKFAPYQYLAYWYELWDSYERREARASREWSKCTCGPEPTPA